MMGCTAVIYVPTKLNDFYFYKCCCCPLFQDRFLTFKFCVMYGYMFTSVFHLDPFGNVFFQRLETVASMNAPGPPIYKDILPKVRDVSGCYDVCHTMSSYEAEQLVYTAMACPHNESFVPIPSMYIRHSFLHALQTSSKCME